MNEYYYEIWHKGLVRYDDGDSISQDLELIQTNVISGTSFDMVTIENQHPNRSDNYGYDNYFIRNVRKL